MSLMVKVVLLFSVIIIVLGDPLPKRYNWTSSDQPALKEDKDDNTGNNSHDDDDGPTYTCYCDENTCNGDFCRTKGQCHLYVRDDGERIRSCSYTRNTGDMVCHSKLRDYRFVCCKGDYCNKNLTPPAQEPSVAHPYVISPPAEAEEEGSLNYTTITVIVVSGVVFLAVFCAGFLLYRRHVFKQRGLSSLNSENRLLDEEGSSSFRRVLGDQSSGSGSGQAKLVTRTVGKEVHLIEKIGNGRFGDVWRGKWLGDDVAVKIFTSLEETSWRQEMEIYNTGMLSHENILVFHASDTIGRFSCTQNLLIVQYHPNGSLYDYLQRRDIDMEEMLILASSAAAGISHLHYEIKQGTGTHEKPSIAHRDIKSKNILVKLSGECCIGDLGHAITVKNTKELDKGRGLWVGTKRYMAPELLAKTLNPVHFESFRCADVYAFGLVLWEIARRARPYCDDYRVPFWDMVPADPSLEEMKAVVVDRCQRPTIPNNWAQEQLMLEIEKLIRGCWSQHPSRRLNILRVKKNLQALLSHNEQMMEKRERLTGKILDGSTTTNSMVTTSSNYTIS